ncbi:uncharacterized protein LOC143281427 [Babylonia areolata]|uniref:uncharacterized protein LOC143281427 n=1 Tax=Babylonia areolata TaxID=304850 RepID=UPI003FD1EC77
MDAAETTTCPQREEVDTTLTHTANQDTAHDTTTTTTITTQTAGEESAQGAVTEDTTVNLPRQPSASSEVRTPKKTPSFKGSAKFSRRKLSNAATPSEVLITRPTGRDLSDDGFDDNNMLPGDDDDYEEDDFDVVDDPADHSFDLEIDPDDEYDTDLEMDIDEWLSEGRVKVQNDMTGRKRYQAACETIGVTPASYFVQRMEDREVVMKFRGLGPVGTKALCVPLKTNNTVEKLDLEGNWIQQPGCVSLADMLSENIYLSDLILSENKIGNEGAVVLCQILCKNDTISKLDLSGNDLTDVAAESINEMLKKNSTLKHLILRHNYFEERGAQHFKDALSTNESLETMDLSWNRFRTRSAMLIAEGIQENYGLRCLNFAMNGLGQDGAECMGKALKTNRTLLQLDISFNRIPEKGAGFIAVGLQTNDVLQGIKISSNPIGSEGALVMLMALERNDSSCVNYLELLNIRVNEKFKELETKLKEERDLVVIHAGFKFESSAPEIQKIEPDDWWIRDPMTKLRKYIRESGYRIIDLFRDFDKDCNNTITREEFVMGVQQAGIHLSEHQVDELITRLDKDKSGTIEYTELLEGDKEYRALRRQWAEQKRRREATKSPGFGQDPVSVRSMLDTKEVLLPDPPSTNMASTATATE